MLNQFSPQPVEQKTYPVVLNLAEFKLWQRLRSSKSECEVLVYLDRNGQIKGWRVVETKIELP